MKKKLKIIISGGGTGGHIFPAISIANAIREKYPEAEILFVGAEGRMEMQRVPAAGYEIIGLPIMGFDRKNLLKNVIVLWKVLQSQLKAWKIIRKFRPQLAIGVGGYASGPTLNTAGLMGIPTLIQEQNSFAGVTNKILAKRAKKICVAYEGMERFFPAEKIVLTGNPVRQNLLHYTGTREESIRAFGLDLAKKTILVVGGSLGARTINQSILKYLPEIANDENIQFIWQTGKIYHEEVTQRVKEAGNFSMIHITDFISNMDQAYAATDLIISRAGAGSISEFCLLGKPVILVPSPNVSEDHQTKNALALVKKEAALYVKDNEAEEKLVPLALTTVKDEEFLKKLKTNISGMAFRNSAERIADEALRLANEYNNRS
ncbi:MAG: undecaprenyldiphospho-muramoylpentapeptide beta-N-acetylglucosaminyltransferase [Bacteroides sp.]|nr:undecaprenyldiphospho-muramoylpentapeptide beta-N-acetylglucosaminyltransferase [Bacteroides sp.]